MRLRRPYCFSHLGLINVMGGEGAKGTTLTSIERYDPAANKWAKVAELPIARLKAACATISNTILIAAATSMQQLDLGLFLCLHIQGWIGTGRY